jgi:hypothetical protein
MTNANQQLEGSADRRGEAQLQYFCTLPIYKSDGFEIKGHRCKQNTRLPSAARIETVRA